MTSESIYSARFSFTFCSMPVTGRVDIARPLAERSRNPSFVRFAARS